MAARHVDRRSFLATTVGLALTGLAGCGGDGESATPTDTDTAMDDTAGMEDTEASTRSTTLTMDGTGATETPSRTATSGRMADGPAWRTVELADVLTDETFAIADLDGPVVVQSFAVWCPKCQRQSEELHDVGDSLTVVSLNTDPNEDASKVREHAEANEFDWRFAVSPPEMTDSLIEAFGTTVTVAPSTPIVIACEGGGATFMSGNIASAAEIRQAADGC